MIPDILGDFHQNTGKSDQRNNDRVAIKVFFNQKPNTKVLKNVKRGQNLINKYGVKRFAWHVNETLAEHLLLLEDFSLGLDASAILMLQKNWVMNAIKNHRFEPLGFKI